MLRSNLRSCLLARAHDVLMNLGRGFCSGNSGSGHGGLFRSLLFLGCCSSAHFLGGLIGGLAFFLVLALFVVLRFTSGEGLLLLDLLLVVLVDSVKRVFHGFVARRVVNLGLNDLVHLVLRATEFLNCHTDGLGKLGKLVRAENQEPEQQDKE